MRRRVLLVALVATVVVLAVACSGGSDKKATRKKAVVPESTTTTLAPPPNAPLTGVPDPTGASQKRPALAVKVGNNPDARPQAGLEDADVVFEEIVEGSITRFMGVFQSKAPPRVGPVRSVRAMDPDIVSPFKGIFAYSGGVPSAVNGIEAVDGLRTVNETHAGGAMERDRARGAPNNLYVLPEAMWESGGDPTPAPPIFEYVGQGETFVAEPVERFTVGFVRGYDPTYVWDAASGTWKRFYGDTPFVMQSGAQIAPTNVVVLSIRYPAASEGITVGSGDAWVFSNGAGFPGHWERSDPNQPIKLFGPYGFPAKLTPGPTWVALLNTGAGVDIVPGPPVTTTTPAPTTTTSTTRKR